MKTTKAVLDQYTDATEGKRLELFLFYRDLRSDFAAIDQISDEEPLVSRPVKLSLPGIRNFLPTVWDWVRSGPQRGSSPLSTEGEGQLQND